MFDFFVSDWDRIGMYKTALELWGRDKQLFMVIEEMAEAIKQICHFLRDRITPITLANELADAIIMAEQLAVIVYNQASALGMDTGSLEDFLGVIDEVYEQGKSEIIGGMMEYDDQQRIARLSKTMRQIMTIADEMLLDDGEETIWKGIHMIRALIPVLWILLDGAAMYVFQQVFTERDSLPRDRAFISIVVKAGQQKLAYLDYRIKFSQKEGARSDASARE